MPDTVAERLKAQRDPLGLSRKKLADFVGTDPSNVAGWETEKHRQTKKSLELMQEFLSCAYPENKC